MSKYLLEIGTEELPYRFIPSAIEQLESGFKKFFEENKINCNDPKVYATPRRLAVIVDNIDLQQPDVERIFKGPIKKVAYDENGNLTQAGKGFLQKIGVSEEEAYIKDEYLHAKVFIKGKSVSDLLQENVEQIVLKLQGPYFMRWGTNDEKFSRPIRWIVSLLDDKEVPVQIVNVKSSRFSRGHRFSDMNVEINNIDEYFEKLKKAHVIVNQDERRKLIKNILISKGSELELYPSINSALLDEVTYLCEYPVPCVCEFDKKYLDIPKRVTITVMESHQRYFALSEDNGKLSNKFITITNYLGDDFSNIKAGNERVVTARLEDAIFFFKEDTKKPFDSYVENLKGVTFQKGMGSVYDKTQRIIALSKEIAKNLGISDTKTIERTAFLCKADLTTSLVFEFTELQGFIGADYARISSANNAMIPEEEQKKVCEGIREHYYPLNAESGLAEGIEGQVVGIADKLDTICAVFMGGKIPTGSSDPLGVRRAALGIIKTIINKSLNLNLSDLIDKTLKLLPNNSEVRMQVEEFFVQRLIIFLSDEYKKDVLEACAKNKNPLENLCDYVERVKFLTVLIAKPSFSSILESANRISRILKEDINVEIDTNLLQVEAEKNLYNQILIVKNGSYAELIESLIFINPTIEKFFEDVLVMDKDEKIKQNRMAMLTVLKKKYELIADFSALQI